MGERKNEKGRERERERKTEGGRERMKEREIEREIPINGEGSHRWKRVPPVPGGTGGEVPVPFFIRSAKKDHRWEVPVGRYRWGSTGGEVPVGRYRWGGVTPVGKGHTGGRTYENHDLSKKDSVPVGPFLKSHRWGKRASYSLLQPNF